jgi:hypothetical protein
MVGDCVLESKPAGSERVLLDQLMLAKLTQFLEIVRQDCCSTVTAWRIYQRPTVVSGNIVRKVFNRFPQ